MGRVFVNQQLGDDFNPGSEFLPLMSIAAAISSPANNEIFIQDGIYTEILDSIKFDQVRRKIVGIGDVYIAAQGNTCSFNGKIGNNHVFKNIKFVNFTEQGIQFGGGSSILSGCFFRSLQKPNSKAIYISAATKLDIRKCTFVNNEATFSISTLIPKTALSIISMTNSLMFGQTFHIKHGANTDTFSLFLNSNNDKGNYYNGNIHLANGGMNSSVGENPPLFRDSTNGNYDLLPSSTLIGAGYLGSDIGSFHEFVPIVSNLDEPVTTFDVGWQNDLSYYNVMTNTVGPDGPPDAAGLIQSNVNGKPRWVVDLARTPAGKSGRLISPVIDLKIIRTITRASWSAEEDRTLTSGSKKILNNANLVTSNLEIRGDSSAFLENDASPVWIPFTKATALSFVAKYVQFRVVFRLDGV